MSCEWAGCSREHVTEDDGWRFCKDHFREHLRLMAEEQPHRFRRGRRIA